jgi:hypothetical protein
MKRAGLFPGRDTVRQAVANPLTRCVRLRHERTILLLISMFCIGAGCMLWYVSHLQSHLIAAMALQDAALYAQAMAEVRTLYTSEVVEPVCTVPIRFPGGGRRAACPMRLPGKRGTRCGTTPIIPFPALRRCAAAGLCAMPRRI